MFLCLTCGALIPDAKFVGSTCERCGTELDDRLRDTFSSHTLSTGALACFSGLILSIRESGAEDGEVPAVGADPEAGGLDRLHDGDTLEVPTGRSVLDVLQLSGMCEDGQLATRDEERRENFRGDLRWHQGENDPNPKGWKKIDKLAQVDPSWFCKLMPDETRPIRFAVIDGDTGSVETFTTLTLKRVAGQAQRITFKEADTDDTDDGERGASARYEAEACDSLANSAHRCACAARLTTSTTNDADDDLANLCQLEVRRWVKGSDPADATVDLLSLDANDVAVVLEETDATFIEVRLVDATNNKQPIEDLRVSLAMKIYPQNGEDDVDGQLNVARTVELRLENELGRAARAAREAAQRVALPPVPAMPVAPPRPPRAPVAPPAPAPEPAATPAKTGGERRGKKRPRAENNGTFAEAVLASVTCPISQSLVVRPVIAEDGKCYERAHIERWLRQKKSSPLTNQRMGTRLADHTDGRHLVASAIENGLVDADAATAWHIASARLKLVGELPGGLDSAKEHLAAAAPSPESERAEEAPEREALLEAFALRDRMLALVKRGDRLGLGREFERLLTVDRPSGVVAAAGAPMTAWRGDLVPDQSMIRIINNVDEFRRLCERPAPGAGLGEGGQPTNQTPGPGGQRETTPASHAPSRLSSGTSVVSASPACAF